MEKTTLKIEGMSCGGCVSSVTSVLEAIDGVIQVNVTLTPGEAIIQFNPAKTNVETFRKAIEDAGFDVVP